MIGLDKTVKYLLPIAVIAIALVSAKILNANKPQAVTRDVSERVSFVDATRLQASSYPVIIRSQGTVQPTLANTLVPAVDGTVTQINEKFVAGGAFRRGDVLLQIDARDYEIALAQAMANAAQADAQVQEQRALAEQAKFEWRSLGRGGEPSSLTLREPQMAAADANLKAALAQVIRAELDLDRTRAVAPYDGVVTERLVDQGQFVARGAPVGSIHSVAAVDVRLPLSNRQLTWLQLPDTLAATPLNDDGSTGTDANSQTTVELQATIGRTRVSWSGKLVRTEGIDASTQQLNVIARIDNPYTQSEQPLRVGQFVHAQIQATVLDDVFVIPRTALREEREVLVINDNSEIERRAVTVAWSDDETAAISEGVEAGELLVITPLSTVSDGTPVRARIDGEPATGLES